MVFRSIVGSDYNGMAHGIAYGIPPLMEVYLEYHDTINSVDLGVRTSPCGDCEFAKNKTKLNAAESA